MSLIKTMYFPCSPNIPYKVKSGLYLVYEMSGDVWHRAMEREEIVVIAHGGLFESFYSLALLEVLNFILPGKKLSWSGNNKNASIINYNGLATAEDLVSAEKALKYTVPIFFDAENRTYINSLLNYINSFTFKGDFWHVDQNPVCFQIFRNMMIEWDRKYIPKLRNFNKPENYNKWKKANKFDELKPLILLIPDKTGLSQHEDTCLDWTIQDIRSFISMVKPLDVLILTNMPYKYSGVKAFILESTLENILYFIPKSKYILSKEPDYLLLSLLLSNSTIIYNGGYNYLNMKANRDYIKSDNKIYSFENVRPFDVLNCIK